MAQDLPRFIAVDDRIVPFEDARIHVLSSAVRYGSTIFEGLCANWDTASSKLRLFRAPEHLRRLDQSAILMRLDPMPGHETLMAMMARVIEANGLRTDLHIRLSAHLIGDPLASYTATGPLTLSCVAMPRGSGRGLGERATAAQVSSWRRIADDVMPPRIKVAANYQNSRLGAMQARLDGYKETIFLDSQGKVSEGPAATLFMHKDGQWATPPVSGAILESITRDSLIKILARDFGVHVSERAIDRTELYLADEVFLCGSAAEITPLTAIDHYTIGSGRPGPHTEALYRRYDDIVRGHVLEYASWLLEIAW